VLFSLILYVFLSAFLCTCLPVTVSGCLPVYLSACAHVHLSTFLPVNMPACLHIFLSTCLPFAVSACVSVCLSTYLPDTYFSLHVCLNTFSSCHSLSSCITVCLFACLHVYLSKCLPFYNGLSAISEKTFHSRVSILPFRIKKCVHSQLTLRYVQYIYSYIFIDRHNTA
jgi:hypothetical protein